MISASRIISADSKELGHYENTVQSIHFDDPEVQKYVSLKYIQGKRYDDYDSDQLGKAKIGYEFLEGEFKSMDVVRCENVKVIHKETQNVFGTYGVANNKYCPKNFEEFIL